MFYEIHHLKEVSEKVWKDTKPIFHTSYNLDIA